MTSPLFTKLRGTVETLFRFGGGPQLKNNAGILESRLADDSGYGIVRGATPVNPNDLVTKAFATQVFLDDAATVATSKKTWLTTVTTSTAGLVTVPVPASIGFLNILGVVPSLIDNTTTGRFARVQSFTNTSIVIQTYEQATGAGMRKGTVASSVFLVVYGV